MARVVCGHQDPNASARRDGMTLPSAASSPALFAREGFQRYAIRFQYHGGSFLGFSKQKLEDCFDTSCTGNITDLRGYTSVETRLERALTSLCGQYGFENLQVSSRTDRGVHAWNNTMHVDLGRRFSDPSQVARGLNHHLTRLDQDKRSSSSKPQVRRLKGDTLRFSQDEQEWQRHSPSHDIRILAAHGAPLCMTQPFVQDGWSARFSATQRVYVYRILQNCHGDEGAVPFEWDRSWRIHQNLNLEAMRNASEFLVGQHDFTSFRATGCQRPNPVVNLQSIELTTKPYLPMFLPSLDGVTPLLTTICFKGTSFLYRQVRNMTGCLVAVGLGQLDPQDVQHLLQSCDRSCPQPYSTAPPQGLFLAHVRHGDFSW